MSIKVIDTLDPLGSFPVVKAANVDVSGTALNAVLTGKVDKTYVDTETAKKVDKVSGKGLSTNDYTDSDKSKVASIDNLRASGDDLLDMAECWPFAHHVTGGRQSQGMCVYKYNNVKYIACAAAKLTDSGTSTLTIYDLETGEKVKTVENSSFDHMNDITYYDGKIYIANGNTTNTVVVYNLSSNSVSEMSVPAYASEKIHGIEYHDGYFYVLTTGSGTRHLHKFNSALTQVIKSVLLTNAIQFNTTQGIFAYGDYIFFIRGRNDRKIIEPYVNTATVYKIDDLSPVKTMYIPYGAELEAISELDGEFYFYYNITSVSGMVFKGTLVNNEIVYGAKNLSELIGFGRFEKSDSVYINESYTGFFVDNTSDHPFSNWPEANIFMVNPNTPRYNVYLLSNFTTGISVHPSVNSYVYFYGATVTNGTVSYTNRTVSGNFTINNGSVVGITNLEFASSGTLEFANINYLKFENCIINRTGMTIDTVTRLAFVGTSINYAISVHGVPTLAVAGEFTAIDNCIETNRTISSFRVANIPTNKTDGWKPIASSITGNVYAASVDICKKLLGQNLHSNDTKTLTNNDLVSDLELSGKYLAGANNTISDVPNHNAGLIIFEKGYSDTRKVFTFMNVTSAKVWQRVINTSVSYDSGWFEIYNDTHANISLFEKVGVIGDSFASGETYRTGTGVDNYNVSWLQILARQNGFTGTNYSKGGLTSQTWLTDAKGLPLLQSSDAENLYLIALGINDANRMTLGTADDIESDTATTFYGCYSRIINAVKTKNSRARIICLSPARFGGNYDTFKEAIRVIAEEMNVPYVDISTHPYFKTAFYSDNQVSNHPTALNYSAMATAYKELIEKCMIDRQGYFNDYI